MKPVVCQDRANFLVEAVSLTTVKTRRSLHCRVCSEESSYIIGNKEGQRGKLRNYNIVVEGQNLQMQ